MRPLKRLLAASCVIAIATSHVHYSMAPIRPAEPEQTLPEEDLIPSGKLEISTVVDGAIIEAWIGDTLRTTNENYGENFQGTLPL